MTIKILLADDHELFRQGLRGLIEDEPDMEVAGEAADGRAAVRLAREVRPDVVLMDVAMPGLNGIEATRKLRKTLPATAVVALSMHGAEPFVAGMLKAGASGYLLKDCVFDELATAVRSAAAGEIFLSPRIAGTVVEGFLRAGDQPVEHDDLTAREREVLQLVAEGWITKRIAGEMGLSAKTVEAHRTQIMKKLKLHSVAELTKYAIRTGLTPLES